MWEEAMYQEKSPSAGHCVGQNALQTMYFKHTPPQHVPQLVTHASVQNMHLKQYKYLKKSHICRNVTFVKHLNRKHTKLNCCSMHIVGLFPNKRTLEITLYTPICFSYSPAETWDYGISRLSFHFRPERYKRKI